MVRKIVWSVAMTTASFFNRDLALPKKNIADSFDQKTFQRNQIMRVFTYNCHHQIDDVLIIGCVCLVGRGRFTSWEQKCDGEAVLSTLTSD